MSQHDYNIANAGGAAVRSDMNNALVAIQSLNSGTTAPTATKPFMPWYDTSVGALKMRNAGDTAWISMAEAVAGGTLAGLRNRLINGGFNVNQRSVSGIVVLAAGVYGHDRWKAGASGCTYTFATSANVTTLTISAGSLIQVIEGINLETGTYCLSWSGTATAKIGAGSLSAAGVTGSITGGTNTNIEISTGTVSKVQLELSPIPTTFESTRPYALELALCQRYFYAYTCGASGFGDFGIGYLRGTTSFITSINMPVTLRAIPTTFTFSGAVGDYTYQVGGTSCVVNGIAGTALGTDSSSVEFTSATASTLGFGGRVFGSAGARTLSFNAEL